MIIRGNDDIRNIPLSVCMCAKYPGINYTRAIYPFESMHIFLLLLTTYVVWLQPSSTVLTSHVSTVAPATTDRMMTSSVDVPRDTQESIARQVGFSGIRNVVYVDNVFMSACMHSQNICPTWFMKFMLS